MLFITLKTSSNKVKSFTISERWHRTVFYHIWNTMWAQRARALV